MVCVELSGFLKPDNFTITRLPILNDLIVKRLVLTLTGNRFSSVFTHSYFVLFTRDNASNSSLSKPIFVS